MIGSIVPTLHQFSGLRSAQNTTEPENTILFDHLCAFKKY